MKKNLTNVLLLVFGVTAISAAADGVREDELTVVTDTQLVAVDQAIDLRAAFPVAKLEDESALQGLLYSAIGWERDAVPDATRTVTVTARAGTLADGVFTPDGSDEVTILMATTGSGSFDWQPSEVSKKVYQLVHTVRANGEIDASASLTGYMDFAQCTDELASAESADVRMDLQEGVRTPATLQQVLPFVYSSQHWIGDVTGASASSVAKVSVVRLTGIDPDVTKWTEEVAGTTRVLVECTGEGDVVWNARRGVWKATFDILNGGSSIHRETALFDLRSVPPNGVILVVR